MKKAITKTEHMDIEDMVPSTSDKAHKRVHLKQEKKKRFQVIDSDEEEEDEEFQDPEDIEDEQKHDSDDEEEDEPEPVKTKAKRCSSSSSSSSPALEKDHPSAMVMCLSRRTDVPGNKDMLVNILSSLRNDKAGTYSYPKPRFGKAGEMCTVNFTKTEVFSWWSKDFRLLLELWPQYEDVLSQYRHHFSFTINNEFGSILEPGVTSTIDQRLDDLRALVALVRDQLGQPINNSIMMHIDPISVWTEKVIVNDPIKGKITKTIQRNNLEHVPRMVAVMEELGLTRLHISFTQFSWKRVKYRLKKCKHLFEIEEQTVEAQRKLVDGFLLPFTGTSIKVQTCSAAEIIKDYNQTPRADGLKIHKGSCVGVGDITALVGRDVRNEERSSRVACNKNCSCYKFRDIGYNTLDCTHGCRYCFGKPKYYELVQNTISAPPKAHSSAPQP